MYLYWQVVKSILFYRINRTEQCPGQTDIFDLNKLSVLFTFYLAEESDNEEDEEKINAIPEGSKDGKF